MCSIDIDLTQHRPLRLGVALGGDVLWDRDTRVARIRGVDLSDVARQSAILRRERPGIDVVADIDVVIAANASTARAMMTAQETGSPSGAILYLGTPRGLAGLITDIHALGIVDGAVLIPQAAGVAELIRDAVLPKLDTTLELPRPGREARPA